MVTTPITVLLHGQLPLASLFLRKEEKKKRSRKKKLKYILSSFLFCSKMDNGALVYSLPYDLQPGSVYIYYVTYQ